MRIVLFGNRAFASLAWHVLSRDSPHTVVAFCVNRAFNDGAPLHGLPVLDFEDLGSKCDPQSHAMLISVGWQENNRLRARLCDEARTKGFPLISYVSSRAVMAEGVSVGENCMVFDAAVVQPFATIGSDVILRSGAHLSHHVAVGDHCFVAGGAAIGGGTTLGARTFVGLNATIADNLRIAEGSVVAAGAVVLRDTTPGGVYIGNPARRMNQARNAAIDDPPPADSEKETSEPR